MKQVRYLLGLSSAAERERIESEYFEDDDAFQELLAAEDDLIDAYARGELEGEERRTFEQRFGSSFRERDRVQFARAFAGAVSAIRSVDTKLDIFKTFQWTRLLRSATIAAVIVFVAVFAWLVIDRRSMTNELRKLRAESAELSKRTEALQQSTDNERTRTVEIAAQFADPRAQADKPKHRERTTTATQQARHLPEVKNDPEKIASSKPEQAEKLINIDDAILGNTFVSKTITELPLNARNVTSLLTLQPATTRDGYIAAGPADQANIILDCVDCVLPKPLNTYSLLPRNMSSSDKSTIRISGTWIRFQLALQTAAIHEDYHLTIKTADGRHVTSVDWIEPLTPNQTIIDTPAISTGDLPSGEYVLLLMGREPDSSFVEVAEYSFKLIKY